MSKPSGKARNQDSRKNGNGAEEEPNFTHFYESSVEAGPKRKRESNPPNWVEKGGFFVLVAAVAAAIWAASEADRLAIDTETATEHSDRIANSDADQTAALRAAWGQFAAAMNRQAISTDNLVHRAQQSAAYSKQSADAAAGQLGEMKVEQRPFIYVSSVPLVSNQGLFSKDLVWFLTYTWQNTGNHATKNLVLRFGCTHGSAEQDPYISMTAIRGWTNKRVFLGPHQEQPIGGCEITPNLMADAAGGNSHIYEVAMAMYEDRSAKRSQMNLTEYCAELTPGAGDWHTAGTHASTLTNECEKHNCADDECSKDDREQAAREWRAALR